MPKSLMVHAPFSCHLNVLIREFSLHKSTTPGPPAPQGPFIRICLNGKFSSLHRKVHIQGGAGGRDPRFPLLLHQEGGEDPVPALHKFMQGYKNLLNLNIPSITITNSFLVMNGQTWTNQKRHRSTTNAEE
jgi:hypothetical protein